MAITGSIEHPIPGINGLEIFADGPYGENWPAEKILNWFVKEHESIFNYVWYNKENDSIFYSYFEYFQIGSGLKYKNGSGLKYKNFTEFCKDVDWLKLARKLTPAQARGYKF